MRNVGGMMDNIGFNLRIESLVIERIKGLMRCQAEYEFQSQN